MSDENRDAVSRIVSDMLDDPNKYGHYPTKKCCDALEELLDIKDIKIRNLQDKLKIAYEDLIAHLEMTNEDLESTNADLKESIVELREKLK